MWLSWQSYGLTNRSSANWLTKNKKRHLTKNLKIVE